MSLDYHGRLPHWVPVGKDLFLTWRLHGSLPPHRHVPPNTSLGGQAFACIDRFLDGTTEGPRWLQQPAIAQLVVQALHYGDRMLAHYRLHPG